MVSGKWLDQEGGTLMNGIIALIKKIPESSLASFLHVEIERSQTSVEQEVGSHQVGTESANKFIFDF